MGPDDRLRLPLRTPIILFTPAGMFLCRVVFAGKHHLVTVDVARVHEDYDGLWIGMEAALGGKVVFAREAVVGFRHLREPCQQENEETAARMLESGAEEILVRLRRAQLRLVVDRGPRDIAREPKSGAETIRQRVPRLYVVASQPVSGPGGEETR